MVPVVLACVHENPRFVPLVRQTTGQHKLSVIRVTGHSRQRTPVRSVACVGALRHSPSSRASATVG